MEKYDKMEKKFSRDAFRHLGIHRTKVILTLMQRHMRTTERDAENIKLL